MCDFDFLENLSIAKDDFGILVVCAIRYCQGRQTYMPDLIRGIAYEHMGDISDKELNILIEDCDYQERCNLYGDDKLDKPGWLKWKQDLLNEQRKRGKEENGC